LFLLTVPAKVGEGAFWDRTTIDKPLGANSYETFTLAKHEFSENLF